MELWVKNFQDFKALDSNKFESNMAKQNRNKCLQKEQKQHLFTNHFILGFINVKFSIIFNSLKDVHREKTLMVVSGSRKRW